MLRFIQHQSARNNYTNFLYLIRAYFVLALILTACIGFFNYRERLGLSVEWVIPVALLGILGCGVIQHQLAGLAHEGLHHLLFKNRLLNELISDIFCMFPIYSITYFFRLEHLGHHQFVNDPKRDPDISLLKENRLWGDRRLNHKELGNLALRSLSPLNIVRYMMTRFRYAGTIQAESPYWKKGRYSPLVLNWALPVYIALTLGLNIALIWYGKAWLMVLFQVGLFSIVFAIYSLSPTELFSRYRLKPVVPLRLSFVLRLVYLAIFFNGLAWIGFAHGSASPIWYYILFWDVPAYTTFSWLTLVQQSVQHSNADRGVLTNSRIMDLNPLLNFCLFPVSLGYHQAHHIFPSVPHYRVRDMHHELMKYPEYRDQISISSGFAFSRMGKKKYPTVLESLTISRKELNSEDIFIDSRVVNDDRLESIPSDLAPSV